MSEETKPHIPQPCVHVAYAYTDENGGTRIGRTHITGLVDITTVDQLNMFEKVLAEQSPDRKDPIVISWQRVLG